MTVVAAKKPVDPDGYNYNMALYRIGRGFWGSLFRYYCRLRVQGAAHIPANGPAIVCANHLSMLDPFLVGYTLNTPHPIAFMGKKELFKYRPLAWLIRGWGAFPVDRSRQDMQALRTALGVLKSGEVLGMFPEGTRGTTGEMQAVRTGALRLAIRTQAPLIPAGVAGTERSLPRGARFPQPARLTITYGPPLDLRALYDHRPSDAEIEACADELRDTLDRLHVESATPW